ncbi:MAG: carboxypeptidase regulatory-like domain-containing protein [Fibrobacter sp.]|uniref:carboxypeptidase-like regulatory domain-containing protein n=1 Tax=Fibrobacter sp. TaxID=35828 RepID=UPI0025C69256|nr:carboxypeptidase-like regulatory domain-containing protein [Fibrobacter sp.]MBQ7078118.1 carboxypeptidase regulatory-like domain-containing protein [Fibrobacter sp.]
MMQFKTLKYAGIAALATTLFTACSDENHAGVLTETESGTTIASIVKDENGNPVTSAKVSLISATHIAARMAPIKTTTTDNEGKFTLDSISAGEYALQISNTEHTQSAYQTLTIEENKTEVQTLTLPEARLEKNASLELGLSSYKLNSGDTLCITGTLNCAGVGDKEVNAGIVTLNEIPPMEFTKITLIRGAGRDTSTRDVKWDFVPGEKLEIIPGYVTVKVTQEAMSEALRLSSAKTLDSMIVPVSVTTDHKNPVLVSDKGDTLALYKFENDQSDSKYLTVIPNIDVGTYKFKVASSDAISPSMQIQKAYAETTPGMTIVNNQSWKAFGSILGISFWVTKDNLTSASDSIYVDTRQKESDVAFSIKAGHKSDELCAEFYKRDSTGSDDTISYYTRKDTSCQKVLDGKRHHYSIFIQNHHVVIVVDGRLADNKDFSDQFQSIPPIALGNHKLEDLVIYTLGDSITQSSKDWERLLAWLSAFYMLQK